MSETIVWALVALPLMTLGLTLLNLATWRRGRDDGGRAPSVSVLIPARDEVENIEPCVRAALDAGAAEVVVYDDGSTDGTSEVLARLAAEAPRLRVLQGGPLPRGYLGKPHACARLGEAATQDRLLFIDADVRLEPRGLARLGHLFDEVGADVVTAVPRQRMGGLAERMLMPMLHVTYTSWFWLELVHRSSDVRFLAANGQVLALRRATYEAIGGFDAVRDQVVDDMAICRRAKRAGRKVVFADGHRIAACRMYRGLDEIWAGFTKNLYAGIGAQPAALALVLSLYGAAFVLPWLALPVALLWSPSLVLPASIAVAANVLLRAALVLRLDHPASGVLHHPLGALGFCAIAVGSWRGYARGTLTWRGRKVGSTLEPAAPAEGPLEATS